MKTTLAAAVLGLGTLVGHAAAADTCGGVYSVRSGDSLSIIADHLYKDVGKWSLIHTHNLSTIGSRPNAIRVGMKLDMPCIDGLPVGLQGGKKIDEAKPVEAQPVAIQAGHAEVRHKINLLTADDFQPFTGKELHNGGLITEIIKAAMTAVDPTDGFAIHWVDLWTAHEEPLLSNALLDAGFPWYKPDCGFNPDEPRCANFHFSDPMFEVLVLMFTDKDRPLTFSKDEDLFGKTFCRPQGYESYLFDENRRNWLRDGKVKLVQPLTPEECYEMVLEGDADAAVMNEFTGRAHIAEMGLTDEFSIVPEPIAIQALHVIVHKSHPESEEILYMVNDGLRKIRNDGTYQSIIEDHMARIWAGF